MNEAEKFLSHHGVKGMKWGLRRDLQRIHETDQTLRKVINRAAGKTVYKTDSLNNTPSTKLVRNDKGHEGQQVRARKLTKLDKKWRNKNSSPREMIKIYNEAATRMNSQIDTFNSRYKDEALKDPKKLAAYENDYKRTFGKMFQEAADSRGVNPSGTKQLEVHITDSFLTIGVKDVQHDDTSVVKFKLTRNPVGKIVGIEHVQDLVQSSMTPDEFLAHFGVKGMHWGIRNKPKPISSEGKRVQTILDKHKKGGTSALTNNELKTLNERLRLETDFKRLHGGSDNKLKTTQKSAKEVQRTIKEVIGAAGAGFAAYKFLNSPETQKHMAEAMKFVEGLGKKKVSAIPNQLTLF